MEANPTDVVSELEPRSPLLMSRTTASLLVIDVQEKLAPLIGNPSQVLWNISRLIRGAQVLNVPRFCTEQYPQGLGKTVPQLGALLAGAEEKSLFSCRECLDLIEQIKRDDRPQILLSGLETHVCVQQTALDFMAIGFDVWLAVDAVGTRFAIDHDTALNRMEISGVTLTTTESALFEWCESSAAPEFKEISKLIREAAPSTPA